MSLREPKICGGVPRRHWRHFGYLGQTPSPYGRLTSAHFPLGMQQSTEIVLLPAIRRVHRGATRTTLEEFPRTQRKGALANVRYWERSAAKTIIATLVSSAIAAFSDPAFAEEDHARTVYFDYNDARSLWPGQRRGGMAFVPSTVEPTEPVPLLVFLHGVNPTGVLHSWLGGGQWDLRDQLEQLAVRTKARFVVTAPSQTRQATACSSLWQGFDLEGLISSTSLALASEASIDSTRVYVVGHSGAGCNLDGGLLSAVAPHGSVVPRGILAIDTCLDQEVGSRFARRSPETRLWVTWQDISWKRSPDEFRDAVEREQPADAWFRMEILETNPRDPHNGIVMPSLQRMIEEWVASEQVQSPRLPPSDQTSRSDSPSGSGDVDETAPASLQGTENH